MMHTISCSSSSNRSTEHLAGKLTSQSAGQLVSWPVGQLIGLVVSIVRSFCLAEFSVLFKVSIFIHSELGYTGLSPMARDVTVMYTAAAASAWRRVWTLCV